MLYDKTQYDMADDKKKSTAREQIDDNLRRVYDDALQQEVPDKFLDLIAQLKAGKGNNSDER